MKSATLVIMVLGVVVAGCSKKETTATRTNSVASAVAAVTASAADLKIEDVKVGTGAVAAKEKQITIHYTGSLLDGKKFDSSYDHGRPLTFYLGTGQAIPGMDRGLVGMRVGGTRKLTIPPGLAYGAAGAGRGAIPPNATLIFEVELLEVK